jgi:hypothetical protein
MTETKSNAEKVKDFLKPTKKKISIVGLTALTLAGLALWNKTGLDVNVFAVGFLPGARKSFLTYIKYNPLLYPISHLVGHSKDEFTTSNLFEYLWWSKYFETISHQFIVNIPYYLGVGYAIGCSIYEGIRRTGYSFYYAKNKVFGKIDRFLKRT